MRVNYRGIFIDRVREICYFLSSQQTRRLEKTAAPDCEICRLCWAYVCVYMPSRTERKMKKEQKRMCVCELSNLISRKIIENLQQQLFEIKIPLLLSCKESVLIAVFSKQRVIRRRIERGSKTPNLFCYLLKLLFQSRAFKRISIPQKLKIIMAASRPPSRVLVLVIHKRRAPWMPRPPVSEQGKVNEKVLPPLALSRGIHGGSWALTIAEEVIGNFTGNYSVRLALRVQTACVTLPTLLKTK